MNVYEIFTLVLMLAQTFFTWLAHSSYKNSLINKRLAMDSQLAHTLRKLVLLDHSREHAETIANWLQESQAQMQVGIEMFQSEKQPIPQRLAWSLGIVAETNRGIIEPHLAELIGFFPRASHQAERRAIARILAMKHIPIPYDSLGELAEICVLWVPSPNFSIAVRAFSMEIMVKIARLLPELAREFALTISEIQLQHEGPGVRSKARKTLQALEKIHGKVS